MADGLMLLALQRGNKNTDEHIAQQLRAKQEEADRKKAARKAKKLEEAEEGNEEEAETEEEDEEAEPEWDPEVKTYPAALSLSLSC